MPALSVASQLINLSAALLLLLSFAMLSQRRTAALVNLYTLQGIALALSTLVVAASTGQRHLYFSAALTFVLKVLVLPWILYRLIKRLDVRWETETRLNIPATMIVGLFVVIFAFGLAEPISQLATTATRSTLGIALGVVLLLSLIHI